MTTSTIKGYELQATNTNSGTWGSVLNAQVIQYIDQNMGGVTNVTLSSSNVVLSASDSRNAIIRLTGALLANVTVTISNLTASPSQYGGGFYFVENLTSGNFSVTIRNTNVATGVVAPQGMRVTLISDAVNGVRIASSDAFPSGTTMTFIQTSAPSGWTKSTTHNNKSLRIVSSSGGGSGGSVDFTTAFASQAVTGTVGNTTLTVDQIPSHSHNWTRAYTGNSVMDHTNITSGIATGGNNLTLTSPGLPAIQNTGGGQSHTHTFSGTSINLAVQYVDAIICTKD